MPTTAPIQAAIYVKEAAGYPDGENSKELQSSECEDFCIAQGFEISTRYYDPPGSRHQFEWMMGDATEENPPFDIIVVWKLRNFSWSLDETVLCRDKGIFSIQESFPSISYGYRNTNYRMYLCCPS